MHWEVGTRDISLVVVVGVVVVDVAIVDVVVDTVVVVVLTTNTKCIQHSHNIH